MKESGLGSSTLRNKSLILVSMFVKQELLNSLASILTVWWFVGHGFESGNRAFGQWDMKFYTLIYFLIFN